MIKMKDDENLDPDGVGNSDIQQEIRQINLHLCRFAGNEQVVNEGDGYAEKKYIRSKDLNELNVEKISP